MLVIGDKYKVSTPSGVKVRKGPGTSHASVGVLANGAVVTCKGYSSNWMYHDKGGWSCADYFVAVKDSVTVNTTTTNSPPVEDTTIKESTTLKGNDTWTDSDAGSGYRPDEDTILDMGIEDYENYINSDSVFYNISSVLGVFGLPYQFLPTADPRLSGGDKNFGASNGVGQEYAEKIISRIPLLFIAPGRANFMTKYSKSEKQNILNKLITEGTVSEQAALEDLLTKDGRYYTFEYDINGYYQYVNPMCRIAARYLDIQNESLDDRRLDMVDWRDYTLKNIRSLSSATEYSNIPFYLDSETSVSESFGNSLTQSSLVSTVNGISDKGRELRFITGYGSAATDADFFSQDAEMNNAIAEIQQEINNILGSGNFLSSLSKHLSTVAMGGRLTFPQIWEDSQFSRSYNVTIKLVSPDCNKLSIFLNILVPLFHLIGFVAPQSIPDNPNGYTNPFIVRAMYKSFFNVDMGIITDMNVTKGGDCQWTADGLPTSIEVTMTIKDLYEAFSITNTNSSSYKYDTLNNTGLMDYICNLCGINIYKPEIGRQISMWLFNNFANRVVDIPRDIWSSLNQTIQNGVISFYRAFGYS